MKKKNFYIFLVFTIFNVQAAVVLDKAEQTPTTHRSVNPTDGVIINNITVNEEKQAQPIIYVVPGNDYITPSATNNAIQQEMSRQKSIQRSNNKSIYYSDK